MFMLKPFFAEMRRTYTPSIYCHLRKSPKFQYIDFRVNYTQIDNKQSNCIIFQPIFNSNEIHRTQQNPLFKLVMLKQTEQEFDNYRYVKIDIGSVSLNIENDLWTKVAGFLKENKKFGKDYSCASAYVIDISAARKNITAKTNNVSYFNSFIERNLIMLYSISGRYI